jgi:hypothetical protein
MTGMRPAGRLLAVLLIGAALLAGCGDSTGYGNVQGGTGRAPGAPPAPAQQTPAGTATATR